MTEELADQTLDLRCSAWSRQQGIDPVGTAGSYGGYLLVEWPLPWPPDLGEIDELAPLAARASSAGVRLQGLVARPGSASRNVVYYGAPPGPFRNFERHELEVTPGDVVEAARTLLGEATAVLDGEDGDGPSGGDDGAGPPAGGTGVARGPSLRDVLICTHGRRDRCCGSLGTALFERLAERIEDGTSSLPGTVRLWRTSHTGGHRFAPTGIVLPEGTMWGYLDEELLAAVLGRQEPAATHLSGYRGCSGLASRELQALERAAIGELGWEVLDAHRSGQIDAPPAAGGGARSNGDAPGGELSRAMLELAWDDGRRAAFSAEVGVVRHVPIPDCGQPIELSYKVERELGLRNLHRLH